MKRFAFLLALAGLMALPSPASAWFFRCWCAQRYGGYGYGRYGYAVPYYQPYVVPAYPAPYAAPLVYPTVPLATVPRTPAPVAPNRAPVVTVTPGTPETPPSTKQESDDQVRPAAVGPAPASPAAAPAPMAPLTIPDPMVPSTKSRGTSDSKLSPSAVPMPAPAPPSSDSLPPISLPAPKKTTGGKEDLPPLVLPPETPGGPSGVIPPVKPSTSRSSPLTGGMKVQVFAASGPAPASTLRKIGFFNHTDRDIRLVIEGKAVTLPKKSYLHAELPSKFTWKHSDRLAETAAVPDDAAGIDVLFKE
jgi:hypothetical protein